MDPALRELLRNEPADRVVEAIIRFRRSGVPLPGVRIVAPFGRIATCRLPLAVVPEVRAHPEVVSLKAARLLGPEVPFEHHEHHEHLEHQVEPRRPRWEVPRRAAGLPLTGAGVVVGVVDWGLDVDHPNFKRPDGSTRLIA